MRLAGKVAIVSGAASGMGAATARRFAAEGARVVVGDVLAAEGAAVVAAIRAAGGEARFVHLDVTAEASWRDAIAATVAAYGKLDIAVNNAGISGSKVTDTMETDAWHRLMAVNATGVFLGMKFEIAAVQFGKDNIRVNSIHPGLMPPMRTSGATADPAVRAKMLKRVPLGRAGEVDEVANAVLFLASDEASYVTGAELYVDGGYLAG